MTATRFLKALLEVSVSMGLVIILLVAATPWLRKSFSARWLYLVWLLLAIRLLIPINLPFSSTPLQLSIPDLQTVAVGRPQPNSPPLTEASVEPIGEPAAQEAQGISLPKLAVVLWSVGCLIFLGYQLGAYWLFCIQISRWGQPVRNGEINRVIGLLLAELGRPQRATALISERAPTPMIIGFAQPRLILPHEQYSEQELHFIIKHELLHLRRRDHWYKLLLVLSAGMHWFNPLAHLMAREANAQLELACDEEVINGTDLAYRRQYGEAILAGLHRQHSCRAVLPTQLHGGVQTMKRRFDVIMSREQKKNGLAAFGLITLLVLIGAMLVTITHVTAADPVFGQQGEVIASLAGVVLSAGNQSEGVYSQLTLSAGGEEKSFPWVTIDKPSFLPRLSFCDLTGDGVDELLIVLCQGEGSGVLAEEVHVLRSDDLSEVAVEHPLTALSKWMSSEVTDAGVLIKVAGSPPLLIPSAVVEAQVAEPERWFTGLALGSELSFELSDGRIFARAGAQISPAGFLGEFILTYGFDGDNLVAESVHFFSDLSW